MLVRGDVVSFLLFSCGTRAAGRGRSSSKGKGKAKGKAKGPTNAELMPRRVYPSALAFMAEHFPSQENQVPAVTVV